MLLQCLLPGQVPTSNAKTAPELVKMCCRFEEAERLCRSAINILEKSVGEDDVNVAAALSLQATCLQ